MVFKPKRDFYRHKRFWFLLSGFIFLIVFIYSSLAIFKSITYTTNTPRSIGSETPATQSLAYEEIVFPTANDPKLNLRGWWISSPNSKQVIILVHGRGSDRLSFKELFKPLVEAGYNVLAFELRGHGLSDNAKCTWGITEQWDVVGAVNYAKTRGISSSSIGVIGWSIGAASSLMAMGQTSDIKAGVIESAYANADPLLAHNPLYPGLVVALGLIQHVDINQIRPDEAFSKLGQRHVLLIHDQNDTGIPLVQAQTLLKAGGSNVSFWLVPDSVHASAVKSHYDEYIARVLSFFKAELLPT